MAELAMYIPLMFRGGLILFLSFFRSFLFLSFFLPSPFLFPYSGESNLLARHALGSVALSSFCGVMSPVVGPAGN
jgi:hypothetical protein